MALKQASRRLSRALARRLLAAATLLVAFLAVLGGPLHMLVVRHAVCPEHGELLHVAADAPPPLSCGLPSHGSAAERSRAGRGSEGPGYTGAPGGAEVEHTTCDVALLGRESFVPSAPSAGEVSAAPSVVAALGDQTLVHVSFPRFLLAPKQSPPA